MLIIPDNTRQLGPSDLRARLDEVSLDKLFGKWIRAGGNRWFVTQAEATLVHNNLEIAFEAVIQNAFTGAWKARSDFPSAFRMQGLLSSFSAKDGRGTADIVGAGKGKSFQMDDRQWGTPDDLAKALAPIQQFSAGASIDPSAIVGKPADEAIISGYFFGRGFPDNSLVPSLATMRDTTPLQRGMLVPFSSLESNGIKIALRGITAHAPEPTRKEFK